MCQGPVSPKTFLGSVAQGVFLVIILPLIAALVAIGLGVLFGEPG